MANIFAGKLKIHWISFFIFTTTSRTYFWKSRTGWIYSFWTYLIKAAAAFNFSITVKISPDGSPKPNASLTARIPSLINLEMALIYFFNPMFFWISKEKSQTWDIWEFKLSTIVPSTMPTPKAGGFDGKFFFLSLVSAEVKESIFATLGLGIASVAIMMFLF